MAVENQKVIKFLTRQEKEKISEKINLTRTALCYVTNYEDNSKVRESIDFERRVNDIKKVLNEIKINSSEEENQKELLEQNILEVMEKLTQGVDYWENIEHELLKIERQNLKNAINDNLTKHSELNDRVKEKLEKGTKQEKIEDIYWELDKPQELLEEIKNGNLNEVIIESIEKGEQDSDIHLRAIGVSEKLNKKIAKDLREEVEEKTLLLDEATEENERNGVLIKQLQQQLKEKSELLDEANEELERKDKEFKEEIKNKDNKIEDLTRKLSFAIKKLPSLPKKSSNKLKVLKTKIKTKSQQLIEKVKQQSQELVARIEIRIK